MRLATTGTETENLFETLANKLPVGLYLIQNGRFFYVNPGFQNTIGYREHELLGKDSLELVVPEDREMVRENAIKMLKGELTLPYQFRVVHKDGSIKWVMESVVSTQYRGRRATLGYLADVTEHKRTEDALQAEKNKLQSLVDAMEEHLTIRDKDYNLIYQGELSKKIFGDRLGEKCYRVFGGQDKVCDGCPVEKAFKDGKSHIAERKTVTPSGDVIFWENTANPIRDAQGKIVACLEIARDITERKQVEEALRQSEENYKSLFDNSVVGMIVLDAETMKIVMTNRAAAKIFEFNSPEEGIGLNPVDFIPPEDREMLLKVITKDMFEQDLRRTEEFRAVTKNGREIWIVTNGARIMHEGRLAGLVSFVDITERKKAEEALNLQRAYFQQLFDSSPDAIAMVDMNDKMIQVNKGFETLFGYSEEEAKGKSINELIIPEQDRQVALALTERVLQGETIRRESARRRKDGSLVDVYILGYPIRSDGRVVGAFVIYTDITKRKKAKKALRLAAQEWRETFDAITDAISIHDRDYRIRRANKAFADLFHTEISQVIGKYCYELHKVAKPRSGCPHQQTLSTKKPATAEFYESHLGKYLLEATSPIFDKQGEVIGTVRITRDITAQKQQDERLMMADRLASVGELAAGCAHELNNPLTSIIGFSQLLRGKDIPHDIREDVEFIYNEAQRAASITKNLMTFAGKHTPMKQLSQINNIIEDVLKLRAHELKVNNIAVEKQLAPDLPEIMVDYFQMQQVFLNIIINAEYFMIEAHKKGTLTIATKKQNGKAMISFADDGPGIPPENLRRIFDPFFTTKPIGKGTGLGLSICHGIVAEHGGQIYVASQLGKGATFIIELPINSRNHIGTSP